MLPARRFALQHAPPGRLAFLVMAEVILNASLPSSPSMTSMVHWRDIDNWALRLSWTSAQYGFVVHRVGSPL